MNRTIFLPAALAALALFSCNRETGLPEGKPVEVNVTIQGTAPTRATGVEYAAESRVQNLQVYVFNDGKLEDYRDAGEAMTAQLTATSGVRTVWALVNAPALTDITTETELKGRVSLLTDNRTDAFVMAGSASQELTDGGTVPVTVRRIVSRVSIRKIRTEFQYALATEKLVVNGIYLINVAADNNYAADGTPSGWANQLGHKDKAYDALLYDGLNVKIGNDMPYEKEHVFYPYPNPTEAASHDDAWNPRHTMLVVEVTFQGKTGYYPVELPVLERNKTYVIDELAVRHRPGDKPYKPLETGDATVQVTVNEWETGLNLGTVTL
ncbi:MAG: hypothetical protein IJ156_02780 [Bacteroidales bacterium]|nr:hypothetical protein [Bacteroidales bacterium]